jgi:hypothetical protein
LTRRVQLNVRQKVKVFVVFVQAAGAI